MQIKATGPEHRLDELRLFISDQLDAHGFRKGPTVDSMRSGRFIDFTKDDMIISLQVTEPSDEGVSTLYVETEQEIPALEEIWDQALILYAQKFLSWLIDAATDKQSVQRAVKSDNSS